MRRWNGWGEESVRATLPESAASFLRERLGPATAPRDAALETVLAAVPASRLAEHPLVSTDAEERVRHARGQSFPDWVALRSGRVDSFPDGVAHPCTAEEVRELIAFAERTGARLVPYGGGTSVVGHVNPPSGGAPVLTVAMDRLSGLLHLDEASRLATFGAGTRGPALEEALAARGYTLGHFPQSWELSTVGGWVVTRSSGQQSMGYGRIEQLFAGGKLESPAGTLDLPPFPASAAGPDVREMVLGSEGRLGILTEATVRIASRPEREVFPAVFFPDWERGSRAVREIAQARLPISMVRLSNAEETATNLVLAGHRRLIGALEGYLSLRGAGAGKCMALLGVTGSGATVGAARREALRIARRHGGVHVGTRIGERWSHNRFRSAYLRNPLWEMGYAVDTLETAAPWSRMAPLVDGVEEAIRTAMAESGERVHVFTHLSHLYPTGSSAYTTYLFRVAADPAETLERWKRLKEAASRAIVERGGTISHQHGVGVDHRPYLEAEKGELGMRAIRTLLQGFDPSGVMNPDVLIGREKG